MAINFVLLQSPLLVSPNPGAVVVTYMGLVFDTNIFMHQGTQGSEASVPVHHFRFRACVYYFDSLAMFVVTIAHLCRCSQHGLCRNRDKKDLTLVSTWQPWKYNSTRYEACDFGIILPRPVSDGRGGIALSVIAVAGS